MSAATTSVDTHGPFHAPRWSMLTEKRGSMAQTVRPTPPGPSQASGGDAPAAPTQRPEPPAQEADQSQDDGGSSPETQSEAVAPDPAEQQQQEEETERFVDGGCGTEDKDQTAEPDGEAAHGLRFSSNGDFVGFVSPVSGCSSGGVSSSHVLRPNVHNHSTDSLLLSAPDGVNTVDGRSDSSGAEFKVTFCPRLPLNGDSCDVTPESRNSSAHSNLEASGMSLDSQTSVRSCKENSELLDCIDDPPTHKGNGVYSDLDLETVPRVPRLSPSDATFSCTNNSD